MALVFSFWNKAQFSENTLTTSSAPPEFLPVAGGCCTHEPVKIGQHAGSGEESQLVTEGEGSQTLQI